MLRCSTIAQSRPSSAGIRPCAVAVILFALGFVGCSAPWQSLPPATVASEQYQDMTCDRLKNEKARLTREAGNLSPSLFPTGGEEKRKADLAQVDGAIVAIGKEQAEKKCPGFTNGIAVGIDPGRPY